MYINIRLSNFSSTRSRRHVVDLLPLHHLVPVPHPFALSPLLLLLLALLLNVLDPLVELLRPIGTTGWLHPVDVVLVCPGKGLFHLVFDVRQGEMGTPTVSRRFSFFLSFFRFLAYARREKGDMVVC